MCCRHPATLTGFDILPAMSSAALPPGEIPKRSAQQRREALGAANHVRRQRALLKADLKRGDRSLADLLANPPGYLVSAKVLEVIMALPRFGPMRATGLLESCRISPGKTVGGLSERQRRELLRALQR
jgi:hypothetical protein